MRYLVAAFILLGTVVGTASTSSAQTAEPSYKGDPDVYKIIFENDKVRLIEGLRKAGVTDKLHSHPRPSLVYSVTDCTTTQTVDGKAVVGPFTKAGVVRESPIVPAHTATNPAATDCKQLFIELK